MLLSGWHQKYQPHRSPLRKSPSTSSWFGAVIDTGRRACLSGAAPRAPSPDTVDRSSSCSPSNPHVGATHGCAGIRIDASPPQSRPVVLAARRNSLAGCGTGKAIERCSAAHKGASIQSRAPSRAPRRLGASAVGHHFRLSKSLSATCRALPRSAEIPCLRHNSFSLAAASASFRIPMVCSSLNRGLNWGAGHCYSTNALVPMVR